MLQKIIRPSYFNTASEKATQLFSVSEYQRRLANLRADMARRDIPVVLLTSMHNIAYYSGFLYCSFGRQYGCVVTPERCVTISANIDGAQPSRRSVCENIVYTDWERGNFWRAVANILPESRRIGIEADHLTVVSRDALEGFLGITDLVDIAPATMAARMIKSDEEIALIREGARIADLGGAALCDIIRPGIREIDVAMAGRDAMEQEIARAFPESELRDTWVWFQSGPNTDGAHNPVTCRKLEVGDILSLNTFPMIAGYYTALERTLFLGEPDAASLKLWEANVKAHELGLSLIGPGIKCSEICRIINAQLANEGLLDYRSFGYGHSFGILSYYYGREAGLEFREDIETILEPGMVVSMEPMLWVPPGTPGAGGYREHDILLVTEQGAQNFTKFPFGPEKNIVPV